jgi:hypothetical protein
MRVIAIGVQQFQRQRLRDSRALVAPNVAQRAANRACDCDLAVSQRREPRLATRGRFAQTLRRDSFARRASHGVRVETMPSSTRARRRRGPGAFATLGGTQPLGDHTPAAVRALGCSSERVARARVLGRGTVGRHAARPTRSATNLTQGSHRLSVIVLNNCSV